MGQVLPLVTRQGDRIAIVSGLRTPFARQATAFHGIPAVDLGKMVVGELLARSEIPAEVIEQLVFGQVVQMPEAPNIAREIVLGTGMNVHTDAYSVRPRLRYQFPGSCKRRRKPDGGNYSSGDCRWGRFLFRIANWRQ